MSRTQRVWDSTEDDVELWKCNSMSVFGHHKIRWIRKAIRHSIRVQNRCMFARNEYDPILEIGGEWFD